MKLLNTFKEQLHTLSALKYVWLTSFNISIEFIETYLLPAVLDMEQPRNRLDYEHFQLALTEKEIDFRVFCDKRFIEADKNKRTAIPVHGISPLFWEGAFSKESLFHPKVIYLEDENGRRILGVGSANLTLAGWGRNQEVFGFFEIETKEQYHSIKTFFDRLADSVGIERLRVRHLPAQQGGWSFVHSFQETSFLTRLFENVKTGELMVWSPYLPHDLPGFIAKLKQVSDREDLQVHLVPDRIDGTFIRTPWTEKLKDLADKEEITFYANPTERHENVDLCHSKIWKLGGKLAIGSWNFTGPGSNLPDEDGAWDPRSNIEAGIVVADGNSWRNAVGKPIKVDAADFAPDALLDEESLKVPESLPFDIRVNFDWREQRYAFSGRWHEGKVDEGYTLQVPGVDHPIPLSWRPIKKDLKLEPLVLANPSELLTERRFEVFYQGEEVYRALVTETGLVFRRAQAFDSLSDLLDAFVFGGEPGPGDAVPFRFPVSRDSESMENDDFADNAESAVQLKEENISFFRLFQATHQYAQKIKAVHTVSELSGWVFSRPGCLLELVEKTKAKVTTLDPGIFEWFLAQEVKALCTQACEKSRALGSSEDSLPKARWEELEISLPILPRAIQDGYVEMIKKECGYA
jgi:hypothetical protein